MQKSTEQIIKSIIAIQDTNELRVVANALHQHRTYMNAQATRNFVVGDKVEFDGRRAVSYTHLTLPTSDLV